MQGIIIVDKPQGFTSFDVIAKLRGILKTKKIGHSGTLDPMATGVLPVFVGRAAKAVDMQSCHDKEYEAVIRFGVKTDTGDITGSITEQKKVNISKPAFIEALKSFEGVQGQIPPMYSAVKINGKPLYKLARNGQTVERTPRTITIYNTSFIKQCGENEFAFSVLCSKGTYIRVLCEDIGEKLGVPATLACLRRTKAGVYTQQNACTLDEIQKAKDEGRIEALLLGTHTVFEALNALQVSFDEKQYLLNGFAYATECENGEYRVYYENEFLGVAKAENKLMHVKKLFCERE